MASIATFENGGDRISSLPDDIIVHILSFLPTKDAFRTSVVSSRWGKLWTLVPNLKFHPTDEFYTWYDNYQDPRYMNFIEMILLLHKANVNKFSIHFTPQIDQSRLHTWIKAILNHNVQDIDIDGYFRMHLRLPRSLFNCDTLVKLKLGTCLELDIPTLIHFPCLKVLDVSLRCPSNDLTRKLFRSCPVLEKLKIDISEDSGELIYNISSPALKKLSLSISTLDVENFDSVVEVDAPLLKSLTVVDFCFAHYIMKNSSSLVRARVTVDVVDGDNQVLDDILPVDRLITLLKSVSNVDNLSLGGRFPVTAFSSASESNWPMFSNVTCLELDVCDSFDNDGFSRWPTFPKLTRMKLDVYEDFASKNMSNLLMLAPNLVSMVLHKVSSRDNSKVFNSNEQMVPSCFRSCLREIEVLQFDGWKSDLNLMKYLLANTKVVEKITVQFSIKLRYVRPHKAKKLQSKIARMPRCSENCKFVFI